MAAPARDVTACIEKELDLRRLTSIHGWLWVAGRPMPPRPLHYHLLLRREILVTEQMDMHLVWTTGRIFIKPVPRFLFDPRFWTEYLCCEQRCNCSVDDGSRLLRCERRGLRGRALGFLFSYAALISHESDFRIAEEKHLLPRGVQWPAWRTFVKQLDTEHIYPDIDPRFYYGELRLSRLNKIYRVLQTPPRGYMSRWNQYGSFFRDNLAWLASTTVYVAIVLTAMQVGLATEMLKDSNAFQSASYGFTVFSILGPLFYASLVVLVHPGPLGEAEKAIEIRKTKLGASHPDTLTSMDNLASTYRKQGGLEEAKKLEVQVMETFKTKLGPDHPSTLTSMGNLASTYRNQGRWGAAEKPFVQIMEMSKTKLGADHPNTLTSMANLAFSWKHQGRHIVQMR